MTELTWAQIIKQAIFDIKSAGIYEARDAYEFLFSLEREEIHIPLRVRMS